MHDLRTPMNNIYGFVDLMRDEEDPQLRNEYANIVIKQIGTLNNMAHDVLDFAKGKTNILPVKYPVNKIIDDFRKLFENEIKNKVISSKSSAKPPACCMSIQIRSYASL